MFYQQVIIAYNKSKLQSIADFQQSIIHQPIWGNRHIVCKNKNIWQTLYFKTWSDCGLKCIGNLRFIEGEIDQDYIHQMLSVKQNIFSEIRQLQLALKPYKAFIGNHEPVINLTPSIYLRAGETINNENMQC